MNKIVFPHEIEKLEEEKRLKYEAKLEKSPLKAFLSLIEQQIKKDAA